MKEEFKDHQKILTSIFFYLLVRRGAAGGVAFSTIFVFGL